MNFKVPLNEEFSLEVTDFNDNVGGYHRKADL